ncbi:hypothetical protein TNCV_2437641 [Trichonephila clavipes]|nr:hypothetical protein TNCV_2437641 [Trichonephila clavipes]
MKASSVGLPYCHHIKPSGPRNTTSGVVILEVTMIQPVKLPQRRKYSQEKCSVSSDHELSNSINFIAQKSKELLSGGLHKSIPLLCLYQLRGFPERDASSISNLPDLNFAN